MLLTTTIASSLACRDVVLANFLPQHLPPLLLAESPTQSPANKQDIEKRDRGFTGVQLMEPDASKKANSVLQQLLRAELALGRSAMLSELQGKHRNRTFSCLCYFSSSMNIAL